MSHDYESNQQSPTSPRRPRRAAVIGLVVGLALTAPLAACGTHGLRVGPPAFRTRVQRLIRVQRLGRV
jgi:hypothetical protein